MNPVLYVPTQEEITERIALLSGKGELSAYETVTVIEALVIPLLRHCGHDVADLTLFAHLLGRVSACEELERFIGLEEQALADSGKTGEASELPSADCRKAGVALMRLLVGTPAPNDVVIV